MHEKLSFCRICGGQCGVRLTLDDQSRVVQVRGDASHPLTRGFACAKGVRGGDFHNSAERLLHPLKRKADGSFERISRDQALDEIAARTRELIERDGPRAISSFVGTAGYTNASGPPMLRAWMDAIGSPSRFTSLTIDQSAKIVTIGRLGRWHAGKHAFGDADVWMLFGTNPLVSLSTTAGVPISHPQKLLKEAKARGMRLVVVDPRQTETTAFADIHLQIKPGEDPALIAAMLNVIFSRGLHDVEFCDKFVDDISAVVAAVAPFTPEAVADRVGVPPEKIIAAAEMWGGAGKRGCAGSSTGPCMSAFSNLSEHLIELLNIVGGRFKRPGDAVYDALAGGNLRAEVVPPRRWWERGVRSRIGDYGALPGITGRELPCGVFADEVLTSGEGQIRGLFVLGGNPAVVFPDQRKVVKALRSLDLLVVADPFMTATARLAHYILPPRMQYERADATSLSPLLDSQLVPHVQFTPAVVEPPEGSEVVDDWYLYWALAGRLGLQLTLGETPLDMDAAPPTQEVLSIIARGNGYDFPSVVSEPRGKSFAVRGVVGPSREGADARFVAMPEDVASELQRFADRPVPTDNNGNVFTHLLASRRMRDAMNSMIAGSEHLRRRVPFNPAFLHPDDIAALGINSGDKVHIESSHGRIEGTVKADPTLRPGVVQMSHGWGGLPDEEFANIEVAGANVGLLISNTSDVEPINAMARQSGIPVNIVPAA